MSLARLAAFLLPLLAALAGCGEKTPPPGVDRHLALQQEMEKASMDFSKVTIVRLQRAGRRLEVASVMPTVVASARLGTDEAKTIFRIADRGDALVLFSRDLPGRGSFRTELPFSSLREGSSFEFPVVGPEGRLTRETFTVEKIIVTAS